MHLDDVIAKITMPQVQVRFGTQQDSDYSVYVLCKDSTSTIHCTVPYIVRIGWIFQLLQDTGEQKNGPKVSTPTIIFLSFS